MKSSLMGAVAALVFVTVPSAWAQGYPSKPIRVIVPFTPGAATDNMARVIAQRVSESLRQPVVIDNRAGGGGSIGAAMAVQATPDGYTLIIFSTSYATNAALYKLSYDPVNDIQPIIKIGETGIGIASHSSMPIKTVKELIAYAKANPGKLNYGSAGVGSTAHLAGELFNLEAKVDLTHVAYRGASQALNDLIGGQIQLLTAQLPSIIPHAQSGRLRAIGVTTAKRSRVLPDVPTVGETVPGYEVATWFGLWGPKGLPKEVVARWNKEVETALLADEIRKRLAGEELEPAGGSPEQFLITIRGEVAKWKRVVKEAKITLPD